MPQFHPTPPHLCFIRGPIHCLTHHAAGRSSQRPAVNHQRTKLAQLMSALSDSRWRFISITSVQSINLVSVGGTTPCRRRTKGKNRSQRCEVCRRVSVRCGWVCDQRPIVMPVGDMLLLSYSLSGSAAQQLPGSKRVYQALCEW